MVNISLSEQEYFVLRAILVLYRALWTNPPIELINICKRFDL